MGNVALIKHESEKPENLRNISIFMILTATLTFMAALCCFLCYNFPMAIAKDCFIIVGMAIVMDFVILRNICCLLIAFLVWC
jgi:hypothetical protein